MAGDIREIGPDARFQELVADGRLWLQHCLECDAAIFHPRILCPSCGAPDLVWRPASGRGRVYSRAVLHKKPKDGGTGPVKHALVLVDLEEGPRMMSRLPELAAEDIEIGMAVRARIDGAPGARFVVFEPGEAGE